MIVASTIVIAIAAMLALSASIAIGTLDKGLVRAMGVSAAITLLAFLVLLVLSPPSLWYWLLGIPVTASVLGWRWGQRQIQPSTSQ